MVVTFKEFKGRTGNLLFQIASTIGIAKKNNHEYLFADKTSSTEFDIHLHSILNSIENPLPVGYSSVDECIVISKHGYSDVRLDHNKRYEIIGYLQSDLYFKEYRNFILEQLKPKKNIVEYIEDKYPKNQHACSVHIRRGDYVGIGDRIGLLSPEYYKNNMSEILLGDSKTVFYIFSDDIAYAKNSIRNYDNVIFIEEKNDIYELFIMSTCTNHIISNSTFSWWGAWLSDYKKVFIPSPWFFGSFKHIDMSDIIPCDWIKTNPI